MLILVSGIRPKPLHCPLCYETLLAYLFAQLIVIDLMD